MVVVIVEKTEAPTDTCVARILIVATWHIQVTSTSNKHRVNGKQRLQATCSHNCAAAAAIK